MRKCPLCPLLATLLMRLIPATAQQVAPDLYSAMQWRQLGPFRAGRVSAVAGIAGDPATYYTGSPGGGVWKTTSVYESTNAGATWRPLTGRGLADTGMGRIGIAVAQGSEVYTAPDNADIVYVINPSAVWDPLRITAATNAAYAAHMNGQFGSMMGTVELADEAPTPAMLDNFHGACEALTAALGEWQQAKQPAFAAAHLGSAATIAPPACGN